MKNMVFALISVAVLSVGGVASAQLAKEDCAKSTRFKGKSPSDTACNSDAFFNGGVLPNASKTLAGWKDLPICLGTEYDINPYLKANPNKCRRLDSANWSEALNMRFVQCIVNGELARGKHIWVTKAAGISKTYLGKDKKPAWSNMVTTAEMCYVLKLNERLFPGH